MPNSTCRIYSPQATARFEVVQARTPRPGADKSLVRIDDGVRRRDGSDDVAGPQDVMVGLAVSKLLVALHVEAPTDRWEIIVDPILSVVPAEGAHGAGR